MLGEEIEKYNQQSQPGNDGCIKCRPGTEDGRAIVIVVMIMCHISKSSKFIRQLADKINPKLLRSKLKSKLQNNFKIFC